MQRTATTVSPEIMLQMSSGMKNNTECMEKDFMCDDDNCEMLIMERDTLSTHYFQTSANDNPFQLLSAFCIGQLGLHVGLRLHHFLNAICVVLNANLVLKHLSFQGLRRLHEGCDLPL